MELCCLKPFGPLCQNFIRYSSEHSGEHFSEILLMMMFSEMAETVRFELTDGYPSPGFKAGALILSATSPEIIGRNGEI